MPVRFVAEEGMYALRRRAGMVTTEGLRVPGRRFTTERLRVPGRRVALYWPGGTSWQGSASWPGDCTR